MSIYEQLTKEYDVKLKKLNTGEKIDKFDLGFIGYALDAVDSARNLLKVNLDFSVESIEIVEKILDSLHNTVERDKPTRSKFLTLLKYILHT